MSWPTEPATPSGWSAPSTSCTSTPAGQPWAAHLRFRVGIGPVNFQDSCVVRICEPGRRLGLEAKAEPFGTARIAIELIPWAQHTLVILDEHPLLGPGARLQGPPSELLLHLRNCRMLANLARTAIEQHNQATPQERAPATGRL